jgi:hypothetical protein
VTPPPATTTSPAASPTKITAPTVTTSYSPAPGMAAQ